MARLHTVPLPINDDARRELDELRRTTDETLRDLRFRDWQRGMRRRIAASRRMCPLKDGTTDPLAPGGRWAS